MCEGIDHTKCLCNCVQGLTLALQLRHVKLCIGCQWSGTGHLLHLTHSPTHPGMSAVPLVHCAPLYMLGLANPWAEQVWVLSAVRPDSPVIVWQAHPPESGVCWGGSSGASCHVSRHSHEQQHMAGDSRHGGTSCGSYCSSSSRTCLTSP